MLIEHQKLICKLVIHSACAFLHHNGRSPNLNSNWVIEGAVYVRGGGWGDSYHSGPFQFQAFTPDFVAMNFLSSVVEKSGVEILCNIPL